MKNRRLFWRIVEGIEALINSGDYSAGSRLPPERELAEKFDVSRPTIREAIIALEVRGKVEVKTGSGVYVLESKHHANNQAVNAFELTQARALIEGEVAALAATSITEEELERLHETLDMMQQGKYVEEADELFHSIIAESTRNSAMSLSVHNLWELRESSEEVIRDYSNVCSKDNLLTLQEHTAIYQALKQGDPDAARLAMHQHFNRLINALFDAAETRALEEIRQKNKEKRGLYSIASLVEHKSLSKAARKLATKS